MYFEDMDSMAVWTVVLLAATFSQGCFASKILHREKRQDTIGCSSFPCANGGTCTEDIDDPKGFVCTCTKHAHGEFCHTARDFCSPNPCNGGSCFIDQTNDVGYSCKCLALHFGHSCENAPKVCKKSVKSPCGELPPLANGHLELYAVAKFSCKDGYRLIGLSKLLCSDAVCEWSGDVPQCSSKKVEDEAKEARRRKRGGSEAKELEKKTTKKKKKYKYGCGNLKLPCKFITKPENGKMEVRLHARFHCHHGYALVGPSQLICSRDYCEWSGTPPVCTNDPCGESPCLNGGLCSKEKDKYGHVSFTCQCQAVVPKGKTCDIM